MKHKKFLANVHAISRKEKIDANKFVIQTLNVVAGLWNQKTRKSVGLQLVEALFDILPRFLDEWYDYYFA